MLRKQLLLLTAVAVVAALIAYRPEAQASPVHFKYRVLSPIVKNNLTIFPVVASSTHDTSMFITLDEGLRSGEVVVTEAGQIAGLMRRRAMPVYERAEVNRLVLVNNSNRPLILLAGEIVSGGKQDRVVGRDRIVPPKSDPVDLSVFCVEPGRWSGPTATFGAKLTPMAQPSVRGKVMADKNQAKVWDKVRESIAGVADAAPAAAKSSTSYAQVMSNEEVKRQVDSVAEPVASSYGSLLRELRSRNAVGVVVAVNGRLIWADLFASPGLLQQYWPKLVRSYAAEAITYRGPVKAGIRPEVTMADAQQFLNDLSGEHEVAETDPDVCRHVEIKGAGYMVFVLTSLLPKTNFDVHIAKMADQVRPLMGKPGPRLDN